jgi:hypothetical protein
MRHGRDIAILILTVGVLALLMVLANRDDINMYQAPTSTVVYTSYRTLPEGYKALYETLGGLGYRVRRLTKPFARLEGRGLLVIADPTYGTADAPLRTGPVAVSGYDSRCLLEWLREGNTALVLVEHNPALLLDVAEGQKSRTEAPTLASASRQVQRAEASVPSFLAETAKVLTVNSSARLGPGPLLPEALARAVGGAVPLYADTHGVVAAYSAVGQGGVVWCTSPWSFSNAGIASGQNLEWFLALANRHPDGEIIFDEYHNGYGSGMSLWSLARPITRLGFAQLALAVVLFALTLGWRFGTPRLPAEERFTRSRAEYLTSMAGLLERAGATYVVRERMSVFLRRELGRRLGVAPHAPPARFTEANARLHVVDPDALDRVLRLLAALESQHRPTPDAVYRLAGEVQRLLYRKRG